MPIIYKKTFILLKTHCSHALILSKKNSILSKIQCYSVIFFNFAMKNFSPAMPIFQQKNVISVKTTLYYRTKITQQDALFFRFFIKKSVLSCPYFVKNVHSVKSTVRSCHIFKFAMRNPLLSCPYLVKKPSIIPKLHQTIIV